MTPVDTASRIIVLRTIALHYHELVDPMQARGKKGTGAKAPLMPDTYTPTVREFERLIAIMKQHDRQLIIVTGGPLAGRELATASLLRWHLVAYYVDATHTIRRVPIPTRRGRKTTLLVDDRGQLIHDRPIVRTARTKGARLELAEQGLAWLADHWTAAYEPMLPGPLKPDRADDDHDVGHRNPRPTRAA